MYKPGDYCVQCDRSGQKVLRSQCVQEWNGLVVKKEYAETRHPLDLQKPPHRENPVRNARPENETFLEYGDVTAADL